MLKVGSVYSDLGTIANGSGNYFLVETNPDIIPSTANVNGIILRTLTLATSGAIGCSIWVGGKHVMFLDVVSLITLQKTIFMPSGTSLGLGLSKGVYLKLSYDVLPA